MMDFEKRQRELRRTVGIFRRITTAADVGDTWHRRIASWMKPRHVVAVASGAATMVLVLTVALNVAGFSLISRNRLALLTVVESAVPRAADLVAADLRVRASASARAISFIERAITLRPPDPDLLQWFRIIFQRPAPQLDPGREAVFLRLIETIAKRPTDEQAGLIDRMVMWAAADPEHDTWRLLQRIAELPPGLRIALLEAEARSFHEVLVWMRERHRSGNDVRSLESMVAAHRLELNDQAMAMRELIRSMSGSLELYRDRRQACQQLVREYEACLQRRVR